MIQLLIFIHYLFEEQDLLHYTGSLIINSSQLNLPLRKQTVKSKTNYFIKQIKLLDQRNFTKKK